MSTASPALSASESPAQSNSQRAPRESAINRLTPSNRVDEAFIRDSLPLLTGRVFG